MTYRDAVMAMNDQQGCDATNIKTFVISDDLTILDLHEIVYVEVIHSDVRYDIGKAKVVRKQKGFREGDIIVESGYGDVVIFIQETRKIVSWKINSC